MLKNSLNTKALPPLNALKGFEAAARLGSFRKAAEHLNLTHVAISHQIKLLEDDLQCHLFERHGRQVKLTEEGKLFYDYVRQALESLINGATTLRRNTADSDLKIETYITIAIRWLAHLLPEFGRQYPDVNYKVNSRLNEWWFDETNTDIAIVYLDRELPPNFTSKKLFDARLYPICSPALMANFARPLQPVELLNQNLISVASARQDWPFWFEQQQIPLPPEKRFLEVDSYVMAMEMARDNSGIALINGPFADRDLRSGQLLCPCNQFAEAEGHWALIHRKDPWRHPHIDNFVNWLMALVQERCRPEDIYTW